MIQVIAIHMTGQEHLQRINLLRWVQAPRPGAVATTTPQDATRDQMVQFVNENPGQAFALSATDNTYALLEVVNAQPPYVRTQPDSTTRDNLLSLPRF